MKLADHLEKLIHFEATGRLGKVSSASESLRISPAAVSRSIKILEQILATQLIQRHQSGVQLTSAGKSLFHYSQKLLFECDQLQDQILQETRTPNRIRIGTHEALAVYFWPKLLPRLSKLGIKNPLSLKTGRIDELASGLKERQYDAIVSVKPHGNPEFQSLTLYRSKLAIYAGPTSAYPKDSPLYHSDVLTKEESEQFPLFDRYFS